MSFHLYLLITFYHHANLFLSIAYDFTFYFIYLLRVCFAKYTGNILGLKHAFTTLWANCRVPTRHPNNISLFLSTNYALLIRLKVILASLRWVKFCKPIWWDFINKTTLNFRIILFLFLVFLNNNILIRIFYLLDIFAKKHCYLILIFPNINWSS